MKWTVLSRQQRRKDEQEWQQDWIHVAERVKLNYPRINSVYSDSFIIYQTVKDSDVQCILHHAVLRTCYRDICPYSECVSRMKRALVLF